MAGKNDRNHLSRVPPHPIVAGVDLVLEVLCFYFLYKVVMCKYGSHPLVGVYQRRVKWMLCLRGSPTSLFKGPPARDCLSRGHRGPQRGSCFLRSSYSCVTKELFPMPTFPSLLLFVLRRVYIVRVVHAMHKRSAITAWPRKPEHHTRRGGRSPLPLTKGVRAALCRSGPFLGTATEAHLERGPSVLPVYDVTCGTYVVIRVCVVPVAMVVTRHGGGGGYTTIRQQPVLHPTANIAAVTATAAITTTTTTTRRGRAAGLYSTHNLT
ncbi:hypothetical protein E2C01_045905 [Portunus trituberculatus]|uniref:Uncharacterized protein n=1 Tax=Portunus trituberculatus TaxID=210409 RepID=A0A5B7G681_PORTR|nr:hypothetical protein [Portunus trituberculatus]